MTRYGWFPWIGTLSLFVLTLAWAGCAQDDDDDDTGDDDAAGDDDTGSGNGSAGCGEDPAGISQTLDMGGQPRTFELYVPEDYDPSQAYPVVFAWHGGGSMGAWAQSYFGIEEQPGAEVIVVYPDGLEDDWGSTGWEVDPDGHDFVFFDALLDHLAANLCVDETRLFSAGFSWGAYFSNSLGCYRADVLTAFASVAGGPPRPKDEEDPMYYGECNGQAAAWVAHGTADEVIPLYEGENARDVFVTNNGCEPTTAPTDPDPCVAYDGCTTTVHWCAHAGGHDWPGFAPEGIWQFFSSQ